MTLSTPIATQEQIYTAVQSVAGVVERDVPGALIAILGAKLSAAIGGAEDPRRAIAWRDKGEACRRPRALRAALQAARAISASYGDEIARSWFLSTNVSLGPSSPLAFVREACDEADFDRLVQTSIADAS